VNGQTLIWERVNCNGAPVERARVQGGWLYRGVRLSPTDHVTALAFVPDTTERKP
jgi:hypothetical protein